MSEVLDKIKSRRSIRKYRSDMIPQDKLEKIIEAGTYAATGMGKQSPIIIAVTNKELRDKLSAMNAKIMGVDNMDPFYGAPVVLIVLADKSRPTCVYDGSLVMGNLMVEAEAQGNPLESKVIMKGSDTAFWVMRTVRHRRLHQEKIPMYII